jgi:hypothetical protein
VGSEKINDIAGYRYLRAIFADNFWYRRRLPLPVASRMPFDFVSAMQYAGLEINDHQIITRSAFHRIADMACGLVRVSFWQHF